MAKNSFRDPITGVLKTHGYVDTNSPGDLVQLETDDFALEPGRWRWDGLAWVAAAPPGKPQRELDREALLVQLDDLAGDAALSPKLQALMAGLRKVL